MSVIIILFSGALYLSDVGESIKALSFTIIMIVNLCFSLNWAKYLFHIMFETNLQKFQQKFPRFSSFIMSCQKSEIIWNIKKYLKNLGSNYKSIKKEIIQTYESPALEPRNIKRDRERKYPIAFSFSQNKL